MNALYCFALFRNGKDNLFRNTVICPENLRKLSPKTNVNLQPARYERRHHGVLYFLRLWTHWMMKGFAVRSNSGLYKVVCQKIASSNSKRSISNPHSCIRVQRYSIAYMIGVRAVLINVRRSNVHRVVVQGNSLSRNLRRMIDDRWCSLHEFWTDLVNHAAICVGNQKSRSSGFIGKESPYRNYGPELGLSSVIVLGLVL